MKYTFSQKSLDALIGVHPKLVDVVKCALFSGIIDFRVAEGVRTVERQRELVAQGASKTMNSKHLIQPDGSGHAVDLYPYPIDMVKVNNGVWREIVRFGTLNGVMQMCAKKCGVTITWGCDWDGDGETLDHTFMDAPHFQIEI